MFEIVGQHGHGGGGGGGFHGGGGGGFHGGGGGGAAYVAWQQAAASNRTSGVPNANVVAELRQ